MKQRFFDKLMAAVCGLILFLLSTLVMLWCLGFVPQEWASVMPQVTLSIYTRILVIIATFLFMLLGAYCFVLLFKSGRNRKGFVVQKTDNGELSISIRAMENLVYKCIDQHEELHTISSRIMNTRNGVVVVLRIGLANGVSIPLAVNALQKQIKQYVQACSGIDVSEVRVQVETATAQAADSPFKVHDTLLKNDAVELPLDSPIKEEIPIIAKESAVHASHGHSNAYETPAEETVSTEEADNLKERKPLHQRLFGRQPQAVTMPTQPIDSQTDVKPQQQTVEEQEQAPVPLEVLQPESPDESDAAEEESSHEEP